MLSTRLEQEIKIHVNKYMMMYSSTLNALRIAQKPEDLVKKENNEVETELEENLNDAVVISEELKDARTDEFQRS